MPIQNIPVGSAPNDGLGVPLRDAFITINANFQYLLKPLRWDVSDPSGGGVSGSVRNDGSGNLAIYAGAAGAADGAQVKALTVNKTTGQVQVSNAPLSGNSPALSLKNPGSGQTLDFGIWYGGAANGWISSSGPLLLNPTASNVGVGTGAPVTKFHVAGAGYTQIRASDDTASSVAYVAVGGATGYLGVGGTATSLQLEVGGASLELSAAYLISVQDNAKSLGLASYRWTTVFATTGAINTSDATMKALRDGTPIGLNYEVSPLEVAEVAAAEDLIKEIGIFKWQDAIAEKGEAARLHIGLTVQRAVQIMESHGLDPWAYGFMCRDEITRKVKVTQTVIEQKTEPDPETDLIIEIIDGVPTQVERTRPPRPVFEMRPVIGIDGEPVMVGDEPLLHPVPVMIEVEQEAETDEPAGERLGFRPDQLALFLIAGMRS